MIITSRLAADTMVNRVKYFQKCLFSLSSQLKTGEEYRNISKIVFPAGIGRRGRVDEIWLSRYLPLIGAFACDMHKSSKEIVIIINARYF